MCHRGVVASRIMASTDIQRLHEVLREAIGSLTPNPLPQDDFGLVRNYQAWVGEQMALQHWASALVRDLERLDWLLAQVRQAPNLPEPDDGSLWLEEAFWRVDAASEKMFVLLTISLGVAALFVEGDCKRRSKRRTPAT